MLLPTIYLPNIISENTFLELLLTLPGFATELIVWQLPPTSPPPTPSVPRALLICLPSIGYTKYPGGIFLAETLGALLMNLHDSRDHASRASHLPTANATQPRPNSTLKSTGKRLLTHRPWIGKNDQRKWPTLER